MLTGFFWGAEDSFAGLFDGFYYIFSGASEKYTLYTVVSSCTIKWFNGLQNY